MKNNALKNINFFFIYKISNKYYIYKKNVNRFSCL